MKPIVSSPEDFIKSSLSGQYLKNYVNYLSIHFSVSFTLQKMNKKQNSSRNPVNFCRADKLAFFAAYGTEILYILVFFYKLCEVTLSFFFLLFAGQSFLLEMLQENFSILTLKHAIFWKKSALVKARSMYWNIHQRYRNTSCGVSSSGIKFRYFEIDTHFEKISN